MRMPGLDPAALQRKIKPGTTRRAVGYARPYLALLLLFLLVVLANGAIVVANPAHIPGDRQCRHSTGNTALIVKLALLVAGTGIADAALGLLQTWFAARIGAEVVVALRRQLFEHIQKMPIAFFARAQTGALVNRLVTDATGARGAFTEVLSTVAGNGITVIVIFGAMFVLSWRVALVALLLVPLFMLPRAAVGTPHPGGHARGLRSRRRHQQRDGGALQRCRRLAQPPVRPAAGRCAQFRGACAAAVAGGCQGSALRPHVRHHAAADGDIRHRPWPTAGVVCLSRGTCSIWAPWSRSWRCWRACIFR